MRKRRGKSESSETLNSEAERVGHENRDGEEGKKFFACYLLVSLNPRFKGHTYIGFTVHPRRRIRQHNGEIGSGACRTKKRRPWEMVLCIYGFPTHVSALQFEWAWQHPVESLAVRKAAASFKSLSGITNKIKLAYTMLTLPAWQSINITVNFFSTKFTKHAAGCPSLPQHMKVQVCSMDELPCYTGRESLIENEDNWNVEECDEAIRSNSYAMETLSNSMVHDSAENQNQMDKINERCGWNNEPYEITEPTDSLSPVVKSTSNSEEIVEDKCLFSPTEESSSLFCQPPQIQPCKVSAAHNDQQQLSSMLGLHQAAEVIDLSTPSPCCRSITNSKKRRVSSLPDFIDLTKSPNFVQL
ncbi:Structure-specific endonuclease subunit SLX1-like [Quillaja saponaria]|uniref:Structure-specific endonuclease subunit SLX1 homolog n=1 Tax=Quillaja saponaria TaxID=32244 RepID=A0AAD7PQB5_QUISA|nr:Structure-specific endonuclease subunit SLX1-like [Quillaja saponaria]